MLFRSPVEVSGETSTGTAFKVAFNADNTLGTFMSYQDSWNPTGATATWATDGAKVTVTIGEQETDITKNSTTGQINFTLALPVSGYNFDVNFSFGTFTASNGLVYGGSYMFNALIATYSAS